MSEHAYTTGGLNRRTFLRRLAGAGSLLLAPGTVKALHGQSLDAAAAALPDRIGVQLYTVRDRLQEDFEGTVEQVAEIGYRAVEFAGYYDRTPEQIRQLLDRLDLTAPSTHVGLEALRADLPAQIATAQAVGHDYITVPAVPGAFGGQISAEDWHRFADEFNKIAAAARQAGLRFAYHNHHFEFAPAGEGLTGFDILLLETDPELVSFELDLMWTVVAGRDPVALFEQYPGRFSMWHVKDLKEIAAAQQAATEGMAGFREIMSRIAAVGTGGIDFGAIFEHAATSGLEHFFVENDAPQDSLANIRTSYDNLTEMLS